MKIMLDLHIHTIYSRDCRTSIDKIIYKIKELGFQGFAITDHDTMDGVDEALEFENEMVIIPGMEVTAKGAHILAYDIMEPIPPKLNINQTVDLIHDQGGLAVVAHPYAMPRSFLFLGKVKEANLDAVEVVNGAQIPFRLIQRYNRKMAETLCLPETGGSDSHILDTIGICYTIVESRSTRKKDVIKGIESGLTEVGGRCISVSHRLKKLYLQYF